VLAELTTHGGEESQLGGDGLDVKSARWWRIRRTIHVSLIASQRLGCPRTGETLGWKGRRATK
jgi:hypothetical protein